MNTMGALVGVDVGGTFTDVVVADSEKGIAAVAKVPSTPGNQAIGFACAMTMSLVTSGCRAISVARPAWL